MLVNNYKDVDVEVTDVNETVDFDIDADSLGMLFKGFSDSLYSNKIGSIVREITSNCFDSHIEAGVTRPVTIEMTQPDPYAGTPGNISFTDYGVGLSPDRIKNVYRRYFASTKRTSNDQIGGFGIGAKSPLSYTDSFIVLTRFDGIEYNYIVHRGVKTPQVQMVESNPTDKHNGTEVRIPIKNMSDFQEFQKEIKKQLMFFDNIDYIACGVDNNYKLYQGKHFIIRVDKNKTEYTGRHTPNICLGKVRYPIDFDQLKLSLYDFNTSVSLRFDIGELTVTMNRESIEYTTEAKEKIRNKFELVKKELTEISKNSLETTEDFLKYVTLKNDRLNLLKIDTDVFVPVDGFIETKAVQFKDFVDLPSFDYPSGDPFFQFKITGYVDGSGNLKTREKHNGMIKPILELIQQKAPIYRVSGSLSKRKSMYLHSKVGKFYVVRKNTEASYGDLRGINPLLLPQVQLIGETYSKAALKALVQNSESYDKTEIDEAWLAQYLSDLKNNSVRIGTEEFPFKLCRGEDFTMEKTTYAQFKKKAIPGRIIVYGNSDEHDKLITANAALRCIGRRSESRYNTDRNDAIVIKIAKDRYKFMAELPYAVHVNDFYTKYHKQLTRVYLADKFFKTAGDTKVFERIYDYAFPKLSKMYGALKSRLIDTTFLSNSHLCMSTINAVVNTLGIHPAYTMDVIDLEKIKNWREKLYLLTVLDGNILRSLRDNEENKEFFVKAVQAYARSTYKSTLNY